MPELTAFDSDSKTFTIIENELPHRPQWLKAPEYEIPLEKKEKNQNKNVYKNFDDEDLMDYQTNISTFIQISKFVKYLKECNVYDNTRIILVSDHGYCHHFTKFDNFSDPVMPSQFNCLLMFKDFNSNEPLKTDNTFMTNADTLFLAKQGTKVADINPFTKKQLIQDKENVICCPITKSQWNCRKMIKKKQIDYSKAECYKVHDNIFIPENWEEFPVK